ANFKIPADGTVKMLDFGIAKHRYSPKFTQQGFVVGTTEYMAPEQFQQQVQKKSDIWSLGVMLYEMLTAYLPFEANNQVTLRARIARASFTDPKVLVPQIPESLMQVIEKSLRVNPASRMSAQEILSILKDKTPKAASVPQVRKPLQMPAFKLPVMKMPEVKMPALKMPRLNKMHMGVLLGLVLLVVLLVTKDDKQPPPPPPPPAEGVVTVPEVEKPSSQFKLVINVQGTDNAEIILANGERRKLPFETMGSNGEIVEGVIRANGFLDTLIRPVISHRKSVYTYELAKIK
ncbi:MAG TPA: protein kinase, partial [Chitinophagaceae bacterium]|nr:protein kinase [Chitinophagaceae bacterium]